MRSRSLLRRGLTHCNGNGSTQIASSSCRGSNSRVCLSSSSSWSGMSSTTTRHPTTTTTDIRGLSTSAQAATVTQWGASHTAAACRNESRTTQVGLHVCGSRGGLGGPVAGSAGVLSRCSFAAMPKEDLLSFYDTRVEQHARIPRRKQSMRQLVEFGRNVNESKLLQSAQYVHAELPNRLARRLVELRTLPYIVVRNPHIFQVYELYKEAFELLLSFPPIETQAQEQEFTRLLKRLVSDTTSVVELLSKGTQEIRSRMGNTRELMDSFLRNMLRGRIGRRVLAEQHIMLREQFQARQSGLEVDESMVGVIDTECSVYRSVINAVRDCDSICRMNFGKAPAVNVQGDIEETLMYVPFHLEFVLRELIKNSMRAVVKKHMMGTLPPVEITIARGTNDTFIRISDQGGGVTRAQQMRILEFGFTTTSAEEDIPQTSAVGSLGNTDAVQSPMSGLGFGVPLGLLYAEHYGGDVQLIPMEGYGMDTLLRMDHSGDHMEATEF